MTLKEQALKLYMLSFPEDSEQFAKTFIERFFDKNCRYVLENETMVSMLFLFDCDIIAEGRSVKSKYLYAAATHPDFRKKGYMTKLIGEITKESHQSIITKPANKKLFAFYRSLGFKDAFYFSEETYKRENGSYKPFKEISVLEYKNKREELLKKVPHVSLGDLADVELSSLKLLSADGICCAVDMEEGIPLVKEFLTSENDSEQALLNYLNQAKAVFRKTELSAPFAMVFSPENISLPEKMYMGLAMD